MARPEGYRKAVRLMEMADRFGIPVLSLVDTAGAYPGIDAEERGQAEAIARSTEACLSLGVPNVAVITRRRRVGRRDRDRHRQPRADAGARDLQRDLAGRRRLDPVARRHQGAGSRHQHEDHGAGPRRSSASSTPSSPSRSAAPTAIRPPRSRPPARRSRRRFDELKGLDRDAMRRQRRDKFLAIGRSLQ